MSTPTRPLTTTKARSNLAVATKGKRPQNEIDDARRDLAEANISAAIDRALANAPELTDEQAERIAERLRRAGSADAA